MSGVPSALVDAKKKPVPCCTACGPFIRKTGVVMSEAGSTSGAVCAHAIRGSTVAEAATSTTHSRNIDVNRG